MKEYHPGAHVRLNDQVSGMLLYRTMKNKSKAPAGENAIFCDMKTFIELVLTDKVQLFQGTDGIIKIHYTEEEKKKLNKKTTELITDFDEYFNNDIQFSYNDVVNPNKEFLAVSLLALKYMKSIDNLYLAIYRQKPFTQTEIKYLSKEAHISFIRLADNLYLGIMVNSFMNMKQLARITFGAMGVNTNTCKYYNLLYKKKQLGFRSATLNELNYFLSVIRAQLSGYNVNVI